MSRKPAIIKVVNLEDGMPKAEQARLRMQHELALARGQGVVAVKLIHGYGSSGTGGALRNELQKELRRAARGKDHLLHRRRRMDHLRRSHVVFAEKIPGMEARP